MKMRYILSFIIFLLGCVYLLLPSVPLPDLSNSKLSQESGDTWQHPDQKGFYTNKTRSEVISELQGKFSIKFWNITLPSYRLNYRPEESYEFVRDQTPSYYLEEIIYPLKESMFVNGWEPSNTPMYKNIDPSKRPFLEYQGQKYLSKVTLRPVYSKSVYQILVWASVFPCLWLICYSLHRSLKNS